MPRQIKRTPANRQWLITNSLPFGLLLIGVVLYVATYMSFLVFSQPGIAIWSDSAVSQANMLLTILSSIVVIGILTIMLSSFMFATNAINAHYMVGALRAIIAITGIVLLTLTMGQLLLLPLLVLIGFALSYIATILYSV